MTDPVYQYLMQMYGGGNAGADPWADPTPIPGVDDPLNVPHEGMGVPQSVFDPMNISPNEAMYPNDFGYFPPDYPPDFNSQWFGNNYSGNLSFDDLLNMPWDNMGGGGGGGGAPPTGAPAPPGFANMPSMTWGMGHNIYGPQTPPKPGFLDQMRQPTNWQNAGRLIRDAAGNVVDATGRIVQAVGDAGRNLMGNIMNDPGYSSPEYLRSIGYHTDFGDRNTGVTEPFATSGPTAGAFDIGVYGAGGGGGSYFHGGASAGAQHGATSVAGAGYGLGGAESTDISRFLRKGLGTNLRGRMIRGQYMPANFHPFSSMPGVSAAQFMAARNAGAGALPQNPQGLRPPGFAIGQNPSNIPGGGRPFTLPT